MNIEIKEGMALSLLPPSKNRCQQCAWIHAESELHNAQTLYYAFWFNQEYGRSPTWADAMSHCSDEIKQKWISQFEKVGVDIDSTNLTGDIKSSEDLKNRLSK